MSSTVSFIVLNEMGDKGLEDGELGGVLVTASYLQTVKQRRAVRRKGAKVTPQRLQWARDYRP